MIIPGQSVCLVMGNNSYEPGSPVRVFATRKLAAQFVEKWNKHQPKNPDPPTVIEDTPENDKLHDDWRKAHERWRNSSPGGKDHCMYSDGLSIHTMTVHTK